MGLRTYPKFDLDTMFLEIYNQSEKKVIGRILQILGDYMLLETSMLYEVYQRRYGEKAELTKLKKAVRDFLVVQYKYNYGTEKEKPIFFYSLKRNGGDYILKSGNYDFKILPYFWTAQEHSNLLTFNSYFIQNEIENKELRLSALIAKGIYLTETTAYFLIDMITQEMVYSELTKYENKDGEPLSSLVEYISVETEPIDFGEFTSATEPKNA